MLKPKSLDEFVPSSAPPPANLDNSAQSVPEFEPQRTPDPVPTNDYSVFSDDRTAEYDQSRCYKKEISK